MKQSNLNYQSNPAQGAQLILIVACACWHTPVIILSLVLIVALQQFKIKWQATLGLGITFFILSVVISHWLHESQSLIGYFTEGFRNNILLWRILHKYGMGVALYFEYRYSMYYVLGVPLLIAGLFELIASFQQSAHRDTLLNLNRGFLPAKKELNDKVISKGLKHLNDSCCDGTVLGLDKITAKPVLVPDDSVNQMVLVLGTTGAGKTITLRRFVQRAIEMRYPLIIVDGKPTDENIAHIMNLAQKSNTSFYGFNCGNFCHYDVLSNGGYTELKDKIITLKDEWQSDYYRSIAEDYMQTTIEVLLKLGTDYNLRTIAQCLDYKYLTTLTRKLDDKRLAERVESLQHYEREALTGLQAHLNVLTHSELGEYLEINETSFNLKTVIATGSVAYFALPALRFQTFAKVLGKLVVNDIKAVIESTTHEKNIFTIFDEFSVFAGEQVLNLVNMGRGKGIHAIFGTQGLADLSKISPDFESQLINCVNTLICHRLNDQKSAEAVSHWIGTEDTFDVTAQVAEPQGMGAGSIRTNKAFSVHPDEIKRGLKVGEAFYVSKVTGFNLKKVVVKYY